MIAIALLQSKLSLDFEKTCQETNIPYVVLDISNPKIINTLYDTKFKALITDANSPAFNDLAWFEILENISKRLAVVVNASAEATKVVRSPSQTFHWLYKPTCTDVVNVLSNLGVMNLGPHPIKDDRLPLIYNHLLPMQLLEENGALSVLTINASSFRKVAMEFGPEVYGKLQAIFVELLSTVWGKRGNIRSQDIMVRKNSSSNIYYIFLQQSRKSNAVPAPGVLEKIADRLTASLQNELWNEIFSPKSTKRMPECVHVIPKFAVGYSSIIFNPCVDVHELVENVMDGSMDSSHIQMKRLEDRQRELLHSLIQTEDLLYPNFQAVFDLKNLTKENVDDVIAKKSIKPIESLLYGFESLIRVRKDVLDLKITDDSLFKLDAKYLRPDVIFGLAQSAKISLELDQVCLLLGISQATHLPGMLMVNILPRNLYHIERLKHLTRGRDNIMFELSESEAVNNFELMIDIRSYLKEMNFRVAADDFGKGYASLERIIKIKPDLIKLDRSLIEDIDKDPSKVAFVSGIVQAAKIAKSLVLAEGVERWEEAEVAQALGIDLIQGFLLHRPESYEAIQKDLQFEIARPVALKLVS